MLAQLEARIRKLEQRAAQASKGIVVIFFPSDIPREEATAFVEARKAEVPPGLMPLVIEFLGPPGGPEEGTGPLEPKDDIEPCDDA